VVPHPIRGPHCANILGLRFGKYALALRHGEPEGERQGDMGPEKPQAWWVEPANQPSQAASSRTAEPGLGACSMIA